MLMKALAVKVAQYVAEYAEERDSQDHRLVVRNGQAQARKVICGGGTLEVRAPRVNDKRVEADGKRQRRGVFRSAPGVITAIDECIFPHNDNPKPFIWTRKASDIFATVTRARRILEDAPSA